MDSSKVPSADELLGQAAWARQLALHLVREPAAADDLVQDTWEVVASRPRPADVPLGAWITGVMRNLARFTARGQARRVRRELAAVDRDAVESGPDEVLARFETQRRLAELVLALREPYRSAILLRYYDGLPAVEIARKLGVPAATVRWRLKQGLDELRAALNERHGGRDAWMALIAPLIPRAATTQRRPHPALVAACAVGGILALVVTVRSWRARDAREAAPEAAPVVEQTITTPAPRLPPAAPNARAEVAAPSAAGDVERTFVPLGAGPLRGADPAKVTILEVVDYLAPDVARAEGTIERILWTYADEVRVQILHRPLASHAEAGLLARAALAAAAQGKFWEMHQWLLASQRARNVGDVEKHAGLLDLDVARFREDLASETIARQLDIDRATADGLRVTDTPTFFVNGRPVAGARPFATFKEIIDDEIARADALIGRGLPPELIYNELLKDAGKERK
jgi:RNA polymerase sigma factor (sigma-70 family)